MNAHTDIDKMTVNGSIEFDNFNLDGQSVRCAVFEPSPQEKAEADISLLYILPDERVFVVPHSGSGGDKVFYPLSEMKAYLSGHGVDVGQVLQEINQ